MLRRGMRPPNEFTFTTTGLPPGCFAAFSSAAWKPTSSNYIRCHQLDR